MKIIGHVAIFILFATAAWLVKDVADQSHKASVAQAEAYR